MNRSMQPQTAFPLAFTILFALVLIFTAVSTLVLLVGTNPLAVSRILIKTILPVAIMVLIAGFVVLFWLTDAK